MPRRTIHTTTALLTSLALLGCTDTLPTPAAGGTPTLPGGVRDADVTYPGPSPDTRDADVGTDDTSDDTDLDDVEPDLPDTTGDTVADTDTDMPCPPTELGKNEACALESCIDLAIARPEAPSGIYFARVDDGSVDSVHCEMRMAGGGWTTMVRFDRGRMGDACPPGWMPQEDPDLCLRLGTTPSSQTLYTTRVLAWSELRGFVRGARFGSTDGFNVDDNAGGPQPGDTDGVQLLLTNSQTHLWTYAAGWRAANEATACPCNGGSQPSPYVGGHYACQATGTPDDENDWESTATMWDGPGVGERCDVHGAPSWFARHLDRPTTETIGIRIQADEPSDNENVGVEAMTLFVREAERCDGDTVGVDDDRDGQIDEPGCGVATPAPSCLAIRDDAAANGGFAPSGAYWIQPGASPTRVYCDMEMAGGGWTLAAVCRQGSVGCHETMAVGRPDSPWHATTAKLSDADIRALLLAGDGMTLGLWRTAERSDIADSYDAVGAVVNQLDDPSVWASNPCSTPAGATWASRSSYDGSLATDPTTLVEQALATNETTHTAALGPCNCTASGWSNIAPDACSVSWGTPSESGPSGQENSATPQYRADVVLWIR